MDFKFLEAMQYSYNKNTASDTDRINRRMTFTASHSLSVQIVYRYLKFGGVGLSCQLNTPLYRINHLPFF